jgi:hypothetical protein
VTAPPAGRLPVAQAGALPVQPPDGQDAHDARVDRGPA